MTRRPWKRWILGRIARCLFLGFATTVLVAWTLGALLPLANVARRSNLISFTDSKGALAYTGVVEFHRPGLTRRLYWPAFASMGAGAPVSSAPTAGWHVEGARIDSGFKPTQDRSWGNIATALEQHSVANVEMEDARSEEHTSELQ